MITEKRVLKNLRKWFGLICAIILYYLIHEGTHVLVALFYDAFEKINILGLGVQVVANIDLLNDFQKAIFCVSGCISTLLVGYLLVLFANKIIKIKNKIIKAICYYATLAFLLLDPIYLMILYKFVGGGDMNGILLFGISEIMVQMIFGIITIINIYLIVKMIYPLYKKSFSE